MYLLLSIACSTGIFVLFKLIKKHNINTLTAIVINYITASLFGFLNYNKKIETNELLHSKWLLWAVILGFLFITVFNIMALTAQKYGLSVASVASKMSVVIPVLFGIFIYSESINSQKLLGITLAIVAVILTSVKHDKHRVSHQSFYLPVLLFLGSGIIDTCVNHFAPDQKIPLFLIIIFGIAGIIGLILLWVKASKYHFTCNTKTLCFGIGLGLVNYGSMYFLLLALRHKTSETSTIFTINNVGIVVMSSLLGWLLFKEKISIKNGYGIVIALISILLITF